MFSLKVSGISNLAIAEHFCKVIVTSEEFFNNNRIEKHSLLFPALLEIALEICAEVPNLFIFETYRSNNRQFMLYKTGASKCSGQNGRFGMHYTGSAVDLVFKDGENWTWDGDYKKVRKLYKSYGLNVLGLWDLAHAQVKSVIAQPGLRRAIKKTIIKYQKECNIRADGDPGQVTQDAFRKLFWPAVAIDGQNKMNPGSKPGLLFSQNKID